MVTIDSNCNFALDKKTLHYLLIQGFGKSAGEFAIRYYAKNLQKRGINANAIIPGIVNTDAWNGYLKKLGPKLGKKNRNTS